MTADPLRFSHRACPHCGSLEKRTLLELTADALLRSNWSYRASAKDLLSIAEDEAFPIQECDKCGFIYAGLLPDPEFLAAVYDRVIDGAAAREQNLSPASLAWKMGYLSTLLRLLDDAGAPHRILDFGCGFGPALQLLSVVPGVRALGYETSRARVEDLQARGFAVTADIEAAAKQGPFSALILDNVLEHVPRPRDTLTLIRNLARPGSLLFISVPEVGRGRLQAQQQAVAKEAPIPMDINPWEHLNYFDLAHLDELLREFGFAAFHTSSLPDPVDVGLRPLASKLQRFKNGLASLPRLASYVVRGDAMASVTGRFYRRTG